MTRGPSHEFRNTTHSANNQFTNWNRQENWQDTRVNNRYYDSSRQQRESNRFGGQGVGDNRRFDSRLRSDQSDHRFNNHGGRQVGSRNGAFGGQNGQNSVHHSPMEHGAEKSFISEEVYRRHFSYRPRQKTKDRIDQIKPLPIVEKPAEINLSNTKLSERQKKLQDLFNSFQGLFSNKPGLTHVLYHEIDTGDQGPVVSRPYRYDRVKQGIIDYHIEKMLKEDTIRPIQSPYVSPVVLTRKNYGLPPDSPEVYRFTIDHRKLNAITKYPRYPLPLIDDLITNIPFMTIMSI
ncbi:retrovirus-related Pol polyprotein from transposon 17.6 [Trichonephila clavipes]|nr:retrovirus-related Pol polyprotein from transposon 17.6 [Trichonephila clavipes]